MQVLLGELELFYLNQLLLWILHQWHRLSICWQVKGASKEEASYYRSKQYRALIKLMPSSSIGNMLTSGIVTGIFWQQVHQAYLIIWVSLLWLIAIIDFMLWGYHKRRPKNYLVTQADIWTISSLLWMAALLYALMMVHLFELSGEMDRTLLVAVLAAFISIGSWQFSALPVVGVGWGMILSLGMIVGLSLNHWPDYSSLIGLIGLYSVYVSYAVLFTSRTLLISLQAENKIHKQEQVVSLLLKDFEENASDWLWANR